MTYNWQQEDWPNFQYSADKIGGEQLTFGLNSGQTTGLLMGLPEGTKVDTVIDLMVSEAIKTSEIEGEFLSRQDVMSSIKKNLGIVEKTPVQVKDQRAKGIAKLMVNTRKNYNKPLTEATLFQWHTLLMSGNKRIVAGTWRSHSSPMQVISGSIGKEKVHFEAPPSTLVPQEMQRFIAWFNNTAPGKPNAIPNAMIRSAMAHLYFETIHPFEDGNGRIGRAISEKALSQGLGQPILLSLSSTMEANKDAYYAALKKGQRSNEITAWLQYFLKTILSAQEQAKTLIEFSLKKTQFFDHYKGRLNERQMKVIGRMLQEGPSGFDGGMSAKKYMAISKTSKATATRDLQALVDLSVFAPTGGGRSVSYALKLK